MLPCFIGLAGPRKKEKKESSRVGKQWRLQTAENRHTAVDRGLLEDIGHLRVVERVEVDPSPDPIQGRDQDRGREHPVPREAGLGLSAHDRPLGQDHDRFLAIREVDHDQDMTNKRSLPSKTRV